MPKGAVYRVAETYILNIKVSKIGIQSQFIL